MRAPVRDIILERRMTPREFWEYIARIFGDRR